MDYTNGYFQKMSNIGQEYEKSRATRQAEKELLENAEDWKGLEAWNEREKLFPFPFRNGQMSAFRAWQNSTSNESSYFEVNDLPWDKEAHDFVETLKKAGITEFAITDQSTRLMQLLHILTDEEGCKMIGLCKVTRSEKRWGRGGTEIYNGILMHI